MKKTMKTTAVMMIMVMIRMMMTSLVMMMVMVMMMVKAMMRRAGCVTQIESFSGFLLTEPEKQLWDTGQHNLANLVIDDDENDEIDDNDHNEDNNDSDDNDDNNDSFPLSRKKRLWDTGQQN